jgi:hypothetical protein
MDLWHLLAEHPCGMDGARLAASDELRQALCLPFARIQWEGRQCAWTETRMRRKDVGGEESKRYEDVGGRL